MSDVGRFFRKKCAEKEIPLINVVRRAEQVEQVKAEGSPYCLNSEDGGFQRDLKALAQKLGATVAFECVAGEMTGKVLNSLPFGAEVHLFGSLSLKMISEVHPSELIFNQKSLRGFHLIHSFLRNHSLAEFERELREDFSRGLISSKFQREVQLEDLDAALQEYGSSLSKGKLLVKLC